MIRPNGRLSTFMLSLLIVLILGCSDDGATAGEAAPTDSAMKALDEFILKNPVDRSATNWKTRLKKPPLVKFDASKKYIWKLTTNQGELLINMRADVAPMHVGSTFYLTRLGFYDGIRFHRIIKGFMAQGGDPKGNGTGGPGYKYAGEFHDSARHDTGGTLSMANAGPRTDGSQFFLTFGPTPNLNNRHTVFGKIEDPDSLAVLKKIESLGAARDPGRPTQPVVIERATIVIQ